MKTNPQAYNRPPHAYIRQNPAVYTSALPNFSQQGFSNPGGSFSGFADNLPVPYAANQVAPAAAAGGGSSLNLGQVKGFIDKMGGIEGIVGTMTKVQKFMASFQQMAPMIKLLMSSFGSGAKAAAVKNDLGDYDGLPGVKRKRRRRSKNNRRPSASKNSKRPGTYKKRR